MNAHSIHVLSPSDAYTETRSRPVVPSAGDRVNTSLPSRAVVPAFSSFVVPAAPAPSASNKDDDMMGDDNLNKGGKGKGRRK
jgi:hypothetical protein